MSFFADESSKSAIPKRFRWVSVGLFLGMLLLFIDPLQSSDLEPVSPDANSDPLPPAALAELERRVSALVQGDEIVGGELLVIHRRQTMLHRAFGFRDRERQERLEVGDVFCVRSMTKPLVGTAVQMLIDEGALALETPVHRILPDFAGPEMTGITIDHLLTHTAGFPFTTIRRPLTDYRNLRDLADEAAGGRLDFDPGSRFQYSDTGSDILGAVVAEISGEPVERFIEKRILIPLGMDDSAPLLGDRPELQGRLVSAYSGGTGSWARHWQPSDPPIYPFFMASQSLYSTPGDYSEFLALWLDDGMVEGRRLLSQEAVARGLKPLHRIPSYPREDQGLEAWYGRQWMVHNQSGGAPDESSSQTPVLFGHDGSDGTHAWAWPEDDLMVLFFTQSRGTLAGLKVLGWAHDLLVERLPASQATVRARLPEEERRQLAGLYWDETAESSYYVLTPDRGGWIVERPGRFIGRFRVDERPGRLVHEAHPNVWLEAVRSEDVVLSEDAVAAIRYSFGGSVEVGSKHRPAEDLPSVEDVMAKVRQAHGMERLPELGIVRLTGRMTFKDRGMTGTITTLFDAERQRDEARFGSAREVQLKIGRRAFATSSLAGTEELAGSRREMAVLDNLAVRFGDWTRYYYERVEVLKRIRKGEESVLLIRVVPQDSPGATMIVDEASGRLVLSDTLVQIPGVGVVGVRTHYEDYREVAPGFFLPFRSTSKFASPLIGMVEARITKAKVGVEVPDRKFAVPEIDG